MFAEITILKLKCLICFRPFVEVLTYTKTECDPIYAGFRYSVTNFEYFWLFAHFLVLPCRFPVSQMSNKQACNTQ